MGDMVLKAVIQVSLEEATLHLNGLELLENHLKDILKLPPEQAESYGIIIPDKDSVEYTFSMIEQQKKLLNNIIEEITHKNEAIAKKSIKTNKEMG